MSGVDDLTTALKKMTVIDPDDPDDFDRIKASLQDDETPRRGGKEWLGLYMGGGPLTCEYELDHDNDIGSFYHCALQLRCPKTLLKIESDIKKLQLDPKTSKFNGKLKLASSETGNSELDKEEFLLAVDDAVTSYGLQNFFYMKHEGKMSYLVENPHLFTVQEVIDHHLSRMKEPAKVLQNNKETDASVLARFKTYDKFELFDISLSRRIITALLSSDIQATIRIKYNHHKQFKYYPGQVLLKMALDVCNASAVEDIEDAVSTFQALKLDAYPGENIVDFTTEALRLLKIMDTGYALPYKIGSTLLMKVEKTSSNYFNNKIMGMQDVVKQMERSVGPLKNPALLKTLPTYHTHGPFALCAELQELYGELKRTHEWPALTDVLPAANHSSTGGGGDGQSSGNEKKESGRKNSGGRKCFKCQSEFHLANSPHCPKNGNSGSGESTSTNDTSTEGGSSNNTTKPPSSAPASVWKYIWPANHDEVIEVNNKKYYFCKHCVCHTSGKTGFYNRSHSSSSHQSGRGINSQNSNSDNSSVSTDSTGLSSVTESSTGSSNNNAQGNLTPIPETKAKNDDVSLSGSQVDPDPNGLEYQGAFLSEDLMDGAWMTVASNIPDIIDDDTCFGASYSEITGPADTIVAFNTKSNCIYLPSFGDYFDTNPSITLDPYDHFFDSDGSPLPWSDPIESQHYFDAIEPALPSSKQARQYQDQPTHLQHNYNQPNTLDTIYFWMLFSITLFWDSILHYFEASPLQPKRASRRHPTRYRACWNYPRGWMILSCYMLFPTGTAITHPIHYTTISINHSYQRISILQDNVVLDATVLSYYNRWRFDTLISFLQSPPPLSPSVENNPPTLTQHFFPTFTTLDEMEGAASQWEYFLMLSLPLQMQITFQLVIFALLIRTSKHHSHLASISISMIRYHLHKHTTPP